jgi:hypothetical protein
LDAGVKRGELSRKILRFLTRATVLMVMLQNDLGSRVEQDADSIDRCLESRMKNLKRYPRGDVQ